MSLSKTMHLTPRGATINTHSNPTAAEQARENYRQAMTADVPVPEAVRAMAEKVVDRSREAYDRSKDYLDASAVTLERSFDAADQGAMAFKRKFIDITQRNATAAFDLAKRMAGAKNVSEMVALQTAYWQKLLNTMTSQTEEVRALMTKVPVTTGEPVKEQMKRGVDSRPL